MQKRISLLWALTLVKNSRTRALEVLIKVVCTKKPLSQALSTQESDLAWIREICYGVVRYYFSLQALVQTMLEKPLRKKDKDIELLIMMGLYQIRHMHVSSHAAVKETVDCVNIINKSWAKGLINAVLRRYLRDRLSIDKALFANEYVQYAHPDWLFKAIHRAWPNHWKIICEQNNTKKKHVCLRVNHSKISREDYLNLLHKKNIKVDKHLLTKRGLLLHESVPIESLVGFNQGWFSVQDAGAQLAVELLDIEPGQRILDCCCAPGGKTAYILEKQIPQTKLLGLDCDSHRMSRVVDNLRRLDLNTELKVADATQIDKWWNGKHFDRILLDAPCSATGVIRKHPDIKILRSEQDIKTIVQRQAQLLDRLWPCLKPGGMLLYATCSILPQENSEQISHFLSVHPDSEILDIDAQWGISQAYGRQLLPGVEDTDGFYYALLRKQE